MSRVLHPVLGPLNESEMLFISNMPDYNRAALGEDFAYKALMYHLKSGDPLVHQIPNLDTTDLAKIFLQLPRIPNAESRLYEFFTNYFEYGLIVHRESKTSRKGISLINLIIENTQDDRFFIMMTPHLTFDWNTTVAGFNMKSVELFRRIDTEGVQKIKEQYIINKSLAAAVPSKGFKI